MRKIYVIGTTGMLLIILIHMFYMAAGFSEGFSINEDFAMNLGYTLMSLAALHGIYGLGKWMRVLWHQRQLKKSGYGRNSAKAITAKIVTLIQRFTGIVVVALVIPHTVIKVMMAGNVLLIIDIVFVAAAIVHLLIGIPKWLVSTGLVGRKLERVCSVLFGGKGNV